MQDAIDACQDGDKIVVQSGIYQENLFVDKQIMIIANGFVELQSTTDNVITCATQGDGCLIKGFTVKRIDASKGDPLSTGAQSALNEKGENEDNREDDHRNNRKRTFSQERNANNGYKKHHRSKDENFSGENKFAIYVKEGKATI